MLERLRNYLAQKRRESFERRIDREIFHKIFPHLRQDEDHGYPFSNDNGMDEEQIREFLATDKLFRDLEQAVRNMPAAYGQALRYIAYRNINDQLQLYVELAKGNEYNPTPADFLHAAQQAS